MPQPPHLMGALTGTLLASLAALASGACGSAEPFCGDGELNPPVELCDDGNDDNTDFCLSNCQPRPVPRLTVKWAFNKDAAAGFDADNCSDLGVRNVEVEIVAGTDRFTARESCPSFQTVFSDIPRANYAVTIRPLDREDTMLTRDPVERVAMFQGGTQEEVIVNVAPEEWLQTMTGWFFFRVMWGGADCADAAPPVKSQLLALTVDGSPVAISTESDPGGRGGTPMNGSGPGDCAPLGEGSPQLAKDVPFGFAELEVSGIDATGAVKYVETFSTFVGAGLSNPTLMFDVPAVAEE